MAGPPQAFLLYLLHRRYKKKFESNPENLGKTPKGCLEWYLGFFLKFFGIFIVVGIILSAISGLIQLLFG